MPFIDMGKDSTITIVKLNGPPVQPCATTARLIFLGMASLMLVGCSRGKEPTYRTVGTVSFTDGTPLTAGWVSFRSLDSGKNVTARGQIQPDGSFELSTFFPQDGAVEGRHQAVVVAVSFHNERELPTNTPPPPPLVDPRFANFTTSGLEFAVSADPEKNRFVLQVTPPKKR